MGGFVKLAVRLAEDERIICRERYTSAINAIFMNDRFFRNDIFLYQEYLMSKDDGDNNTLSPLQYGLVVGDHVTKKIHSMQGYTTIGRIYSVSVALDLDCSSTVSNKNIPCDYHSAVRLKRLIEQQYVKRKRMLRGGDITDIRPIESTWEDEVAFVKKSDISNPYEYIINVDGWEIINYDEDLGGALMFKAALEADGFVFSEQENAEWEEWFDECLPLSGA